MTRNPGNRSGWTLVLFCFLCVSWGVAQEERIAVKTDDDLPRHTYPSEWKISEIIASEERLNQLATQVKADILADLDKYAIENRDTLERFTSVLMLIHIIEQDYEAVLECYERLRQLALKPSNRVMVGIPLETIIQATMKGRGLDEDAFSGLFKEMLRKRLKGIPRDLALEKIKALKGAVAFLDVPNITKIVLNRKDQYQEKSGCAATFDMAWSIFSIWVDGRFKRPRLADLHEVYDEFIEELAPAEDYYWSERGVSFDPREALSPVTVAIWDSGVDVPLFPGLLWRNPREKPDGKDTDQNGFVDDIHGIGMDLYAYRIPNLLRTTKRISVPADEMAIRFKGDLDMRSGEKSVEATLVKRMMGRITEEDYNLFYQDFNEFVHYAHGTAVATPLVAGNPFIRMLVARADYHCEPYIPSVKVAGWHKKAQETTIDYFKHYGVKIVNMSWSESRGIFESYLEYDPEMTSAEERAELAREIFKIISDSLYKAIKEAPEILFVTSAGNLDGDVEYDEVIPSMFDLPNLVAVGAVDRRGRLANMSSYGKKVRYFAQGVDVETYIPGGLKIRSSGTSFACPQFANLAAKLLAIDPSLTPEQLIQRIEASADKVEGDIPMWVIHPKRTVEALRAEQNTQ